MGAGSTYAARIGRHAAIYGAAGAATLLLGLVNVAFFTRYLKPSEFGQVAIYLIFSSLLAVLYNLGSLQGAIRAAFGGDDEEGGETGDGPALGDKRGVLGTAIVYTALAGACGTALIAAFAPAISDLLVGTRDHGDIVVIAAASGGLGAIWRLVSNVLRVERRPVSWAGLHNARPALAIASAAPFVIAGDGPRGVIAGFAIGTALALAIGLYAIRRSYRPAFSARRAFQVVALGSSMIPVVAAVWVMQNADLLILSKYASDADIGVYRVASRIGAMVLYFTSSFYMAWGPMTREPIHMAVEREQGATILAARMATYFLLLCVSLIVGLALFGDALARVAAPEYHGAAELIPLIGIGCVAYGVLVTIYRAAQFPSRRTAFIAMVVVSSIAFLIAAFLLIPPFGTYGAAEATIVGPAVGAIGLLWMSQRSRTPVPYEVRRLVLGVVAGGAGVAAGRALFPVLPDGVAGLIGVGVFVGLALATRVISRSDLALVRGLLPERQAPLDVSDLSADERAIIEQVVVDRHSAEVAAASLGTTSDDVLIRFVRSLRALAGLAPQSPGQVTLGSYLLWDGSVAERDLLAHELWAQDVDPFETDLLIRTLDQLRRESGALGPFTTAGV